MKQFTEIPYESIRNLAIIGDGSFGKVYKSLYNKYEIVAVKDVREEVLEGEKSIFGLYHPNVIKYM